MLGAPAALVWPALPPAEAGEPALALFVLAPGPVCEQLNAENRQSKAGTAEIEANACVRLI
jgi:hypothetical protein